MTTGGIKLYEKTLGHEKSSAHISNYMKWRDLILSLEMCKVIGNFQRQQLFNEKERWREIVKSLLEVTLHLSERNLPFRGSTSAVGDPEISWDLGTLGPWVYFLGPWNSLVITIRPLKIIWIQSENIRNAESVCKHTIYLGKLKMSL